MLRVKLFNKLDEEFFQIDGDEVEIEVGFISVLRGGKYVANYNLQEAALYAIEAISKDE